MPKSSRLRTNATWKISGSFEPSKANIQENSLVLSFLKQVPRITLMSSRHLSVLWTSSVTRCPRVWRRTRPSPPQSRIQDSRKPLLHRSPAVAVSVSTHKPHLGGWLLKTAFISDRLAFIYTA